MDHIKIYREINHIENVLSEKAALPFLGTFPAITQIVIGVAQVVFGSMLCLKGMADCLTRGDSTLNKHGWTHIQHGCGNIVGGLIAAIPIVGTILYFVKYFTPFSSVYNTFVTGHENKCMPYAELQKQDLKIGFVDMDEQMEDPRLELIPASELYNYNASQDRYSERLKDINATLNARLIEKGGRSNLSLYEITLIAENLLEEYKRDDKRRKLSEPIRNPELEIEWDISFGLGKNKSSQPVDLA